MKEGRGKWEEKSHWDKEMYHRVIREAKSKITQGRQESRSTKYGQKEGAGEENHHGRHERTTVTDGKRTEMKGKRDGKKRAAEREASDLI